MLLLLEPAYIAKADCDLATVMLAILQFVVHDYTVLVIVNLSFETMLH